ncbi:hypothetical protein NV379_05090 [Paenibacillus sp. N1-5-1-14]|uniref:hypothetical protein n=1 Tax=Paenibacillus radicibacter TaxID=2972488 RepID=UPI0021599918|nr:hypothetical protein [Paenibacillus radicibacter]MCR8642026.1 hypothetical protein [Paenibacillus radicibacter]
MIFKYILRSIGWADVSLKINNSEIYIDASYLSEPLIDLVRAVELLKLECVEDDELKDTVQFDFNSEPAVHRWTLIKKDETNIIIKIILFVDGLTDGKGEAVFNEVCNLDEFIKVLVLQMENLLKKHGIVEYRKQWNAQDFPLSSYLQLKNYIKSKAKFPIVVINPDEWNEEITSMIKDEIELIFSD